MASDSRLSFGQVSAADVGIKLLRLPCRIYGPWQTDARDLLREIDVAMLIAGSHVTSTLTKESLEEVLKALQAVPDVTRISFEKIAKICFVAYRQISTRVCDALCGPAGIADVHLAGFCPEQNRLRVFEFSTDRRTNEHRSEEVLVQDFGFRMIGSGKRIAEKYISKTGCTPFQAIQHVIDAKADAAVGGAIQYGCFVRNEFRIYLQSELQGRIVRYPRGGLDLNATEFRDEEDDLFLSISMLEQGRELPPLEE